MTRLNRSIACVRLPDLSAARAASKINSAARGCAETWSAKPNNVVIADSLSIPFFIIGASARDFILEHYYNIKAPRITKDIDLNISSRHVIVIEGIVDTGMTLNSILNYLRPRKPASLEVCTLLDKRVRRIADIPLEYVGFEVQNEFVVGYGLDYREEYRNLPFIGIPELEKPSPRK